MKIAYEDWNPTECTRNLMGFTTYEDSADLIAQTKDRYHIDRWEGQDFRVEVWVEKEALQPVIQRAALSPGVDYFSRRGYVSQSEVHGAALRHQSYERDGQEVVVIHLGAHDPSGIDVTRDIQDRSEADCAQPRSDRLVQPAAQPSETHGLAHQRIPCRPRRIVLGTRRSRSRHPQQQ